MTEYPKAPMRMARRIEWSCEDAMRLWMERHGTEWGIDRTSWEFEQEFGFPLSRPQINCYRQVHCHHQVVREGRKSCGGRKPRKLGYIRDTGKGYATQKLREEPELPGTKDNWYALHIVAWESYHGEPVPEGCQIWARDGNSFNVHPDNLVVVPQRLMGIINCMYSEYPEKYSLEEAVKMAELHSAIARAEGKLPRKCAVCGRTFTTSECNTNRQITCPECVKAGHRARGESKTDYEPIKCAVCGREFKPPKKSRKRCDDCIARAPKHGIRQQRRKENRG